MDRKKRAIDAYRKVRDGRSDKPDDGRPQGTDDGRPQDPDDGRPQKPDDLDEGRRGFEKTAGDNRPADESRPAKRDVAERVEEREGGRSPSAHSPATENNGPAAPSAGIDAAVLRDRLSGLLEGSGADRAAKLLLALGTERAGQVMRLLDEEQVEAVAAALVRARSVSREELDAVLAQLAAGPVDTPPKGGPEVAREMLRAAFGEEEGERRFFRSVPNAPAHHFAFLNELEPGQLHAAVKNESPAAAALVIAHVDRALAAKTLAMLGEEARADVARRIARMGKLSRDVVVRVEEAVREKIRRQGRQVSEEVDGAATLAAILHHLGPRRSDSILGELRDANIDLSETVRKNLYSTDLLFDLSDRHLADLLREFSDREIALFLKGKAEALRARVLRALSERRGQSVSDEYAHLGAQRRDEVERVTSEVLERLRELEEDGSILVPREGDRYI